MIILDPGHPSKKGDAGVTTESGFREVEYNHKMVVLLGRVLSELSIPWDLTRGADEVKSLSARGKFSRKLGASFVLSVHVNAHADSSLHGAMCFYRKYDATAKDIASAIHGAIPTSLKKFRNPFACDRSNWIRVDNVLREHSCPSVLLECGFATNQGDLKALETPAVENGLVAAALCGISRALELGDST